MPGEFKIIERLRKAAGRPSGALVLGIGDDCAAFRPAPGFETLATSDMLVEGVHFRLSQGLSAVGYKSMAANISDILACGGKPLYALVAVGLPEKGAMRAALSLYSGLRKCADKFGVEIIGGDTVRSEKLVISITALGEVASGKAVTRGGARPGDYILVSGELGNGAAALKKNLAWLPPLRPELSQALCGRGLVNSMIDVSDGLSGELYHLCEESNTGALIYEELVPLSKAALKLSGGNRRMALPAAFFGGEDYELLLSVPAKFLGTALKLGRKKSKLTVIGRMLPARQGVKVYGGGKAKVLQRGGYDAFL